MTGSARSDWSDAPRAPRTATVTAATRAQVWRVPGDVFLAALEGSGAPPSKLLDGIAGRLARGAA